MFASDLFVHVLRLFGMKYCVFFGIMYISCPDGCDTVLIFAYVDNNAKVVVIKKRLITTSWFSVKN